MVVFKANMSIQDIKDWLKDFQHISEKAAGNQHLQFTAEKWTNNNNLPLSTKKDEVQTVANNELSFLDMKMSWSPKGDLQFWVFRKNVHQLKYVNKGITHTPGTLPMITLGVLNRLEEITSHKPNFNSKKIDSVYPNHANALHKAGLETSVS